ncbi:MAG: multiheme c-type cytochrome [Pirellulaceae bacterium]
MKLGTISLAAFGLLTLGLSYWAASANRTDNVKTLSNASADNVSPANDSTPTVTPVVNETDQLRFLESERCALCHSNSRNANAMRDSQQRPIAPYDLWQSSMMANSARDPFWRAVLSAEVQATPSQKAHIEEVCTRCHAPMAAPAPESPDGTILAHISKKDERSKLGLDGVSCTVCHQMTDEGLGEDSSFTGNFKINTEGKIFGPHANPTTMPMQRHVGYTPTQGMHVMKSALCATCHTVITESVDADGKPSAGMFHEQSPYLEWRNSDFNDERTPAPDSARSCQACHMPQNDVDGNIIMTNLAHNPGGRDFPFLRPRLPFGRHTLVGGNAFMTRLLRDNAKKLGAVASKDAFEQSIERIVSMLQTQTATVAIGEPQIDGKSVHLPVSLVNECGHKFPTAYPSRRAWLHFSIQDKNRNVVFESGAYDAEGRLLDGKGELLESETAGGPVHPHYQSISAANEVQIYETVMADADGNATFTLLRGASYVKDNRLLPKGWSHDHADGEATQPYGVADDSDFGPGSDLVNYELELASGEYTAHIELLFQPLSVRHVHELFTADTPEITTFRKMYDKAERKPDVIASHELSFTVPN